MMWASIKELAMSAAIVTAIAAGAPGEAKEPLSSVDAYAKALSIKREVDEIRFQILDARKRSPSADVSADEVRLEAACQALGSADDDLLAARRREGLPVEGVVGILPDSLPPVRARK